TGYGNTGSCISSITFIDGEKGVLRYRGYPIEQLATNALFSEVCYLLIYGELPTREQFAAWRHALTTNTLIHEDMLKFFDGFPPTAHPMSILSAMVASLEAYYPVRDGNEEDVNLNMVRVLAKAKTIAAYSYKKSLGEPFVYPKRELSYP